MELKGSRTEQNLMSAFAGESQARNKYTYYAMKARAEGMEQIANIFEETARNEQEHAMLWFKALHGDQIPTTDVNLQDAANGENYEWTDMYAEFAKVAREEGFNKIAAQMDMVAKIEKRHEERAQQVLRCCRNFPGWSVGYNWGHAPARRSKPPLWQRSSRFPAPLPLHPDLSRHVLHRSQYGTAAHRWSDENHHRPRSVLVVQWRKPPATDTAQN